jgi:hypothetical protein
MGIRAWSGPAPPNSSQEILRRADCCRAPNRLRYARHGRDSCYDSVIVTLGLDARLPDPPQDRPDPAQCRNLKAGALRRQHLQARAISASLPTSAYASRRRRRVPLVPCRAKTSVLDERRGLVRVFLLLLDRLLFLGRMHCLLLARFRGLMGHGSLQGLANAVARGHTIGSQVECARSPTRNGWLHQRLGRRDCIL